MLINASHEGPEAGDWILDLAMLLGWMRRHPALSIRLGDVVGFSQDMAHKWALHNHGIHREWVKSTFPGIGADVAGYLKDLGVVGVLTDVTSIGGAKTTIRDQGSDVQNNATQVALLGSGIYSAENMGGQLQQAANSRGFVFVMPCMKTKAGSGGHSRIWYFEGLSIPIE